MTPNEFDDLIQKFLEGEASLPEQKAVIEAMESDDEFFRRARHQVTLHAGLKALTDQGADPFVTEILERISHRDGRSAFVDKVQERLAGRPRPSRRGKVSTRLQPAVRPTGARLIIYSCAAAAALLITTGLIALWLSPDPMSVPLTQLQERRREIIVEQLRELSLERKVIETAKARRRPRPKPAAPVPEETPQVIAQQQVEAEEVEEAARFIEARQRFVMRQLRMFGGRAPLPDNLDEEADPQESTPPREPVVAQTGPVEVGRVLVAEGDKPGVLIRQADEGSQRLALKQNLTLLSGDRIETAPGKNVPCASVQLKGGATIDMDRATSIEVLGRDNLRFHGGRIYAHIAVPYPDDSYPEAEPPFSLETEAGRFLTHDLQAELQLSENEVLNKDLTARVDGGKTHLVNRKGHVVVRKGQELRARKGAQPRRQNVFSKPIWRGRNCTNPGLPIGKGNPVLLSNGSHAQSFSPEYALALSHTGEIELRGIQIVRGTFDAQGAGRHRLAAAWQAMTKEIARLRTSGLRFTPKPTIGAARSLQPPASGRYEDIVPEPSPAVDQLLVEARKTSPDRPLVVITSGSLTDLASAWLRDHSVADRIVVVTDAKREMREHDPWAFRIVLEEYRCVSVHLNVPANTFPTDGLQRTRWEFMSERTRLLNQDFSRFACVTVPGFVRSVERSRFIAGPPGDPDRFRFEPAPDGRTWLVKRTDLSRMMREFEATFITGASAR